jgi:hypothetical protein
MPETKFPEQTWREIASIIAASFAMDADRSERLLGNATAKLIAAIPFLAGCREPGRSAIAHLATFVVAGNEPGAAAFDHRPGDDYDFLARLGTIAHFEGGEPALIDRGMKLLAAMMIEGYSRDLESDRQKGLYNPLAEGIWDAQSGLAALRKSIGATDCAEMDAIAAPEGGKGAVWWQRV